MRLRKYFALEEPRRAGTFDECIKVHSSGLDFQLARYINPSFTAPRDFPTTRRNAFSLAFSRVGYEFQECLSLFSRKQMDARAASRSDRLWIIA